MRTTTGTPDAASGSTAAAVIPGELHVQQRWAGFVRWGPYALLALATVIASTTRTALTSPGEWYAVVVLVVAALAVHVWWSRCAPETSGSGPGAGTRPPGTHAGVTYYVVRYAIAFTLTWLNPFFAIYAVIGYFDPDRLLPRRAILPALFATAVIMAGSQSGGMPPTGVVRWFVFFALLALHSVLITVITRITWQEADNARARADTIDALADANSRLGRALEENAGLHAQLLVQAREAGVADERRRLAAEIHDTIAQGLAGIITQLQAAEDSPDPAATREHVRRAADLARESLGEARRSVHDLAPPALEEDALPEALRKTVTSWADGTGVRADVTVTGTVEPLHDEVAATLLRIAQEALTNVRRHAAATRVGVTLSYMDDEVTLDVRDDGCGFRPLVAVPPRAAGGFGLRGMRSRAERLAGTVDVESEPGQGTAVSARVPLVRHG